MSDTEFVDGLRVYAPHERAPDYIIANVSLDRDALTAWLAGRAPQIRVVIKRSQGGKYYAAVDAYRRDAEQPSRAPVNDCPQRQERQAPADSGFDSDSIPF